MQVGKYVFRNIEKYYARSHFLPKQHDTCVIILNFNNKHAVLQVAKALEDIDADVIIVDNASADGSFDALFELYENRFNLIETKENIGGAGGFALGIQWVINRKYDYCLVSEDDALPYPGHEDIFCEMLRYKNKKRFVQARFYELETTSFNFHYFLYPVWLLKEVGVPNKDLFFRADDQEWGMRIREYLKKNKIVIEKKVVERYYTHPILKRGFSITANYFGIRNALWVYLVYPQRNFIVDYALQAGKYLTFALFALQYDKNLEPLRQFVDAYLDFALERFDSNYQKLNKYRGKNLEPTTYALHKTTLEEFYKKFKDRKIVSAVLQTPHFPRKFSKSSKKGVIASKFCGLARLKALQFKDIVFVEEIDFMKNEIVYFHYVNRRYMLARIYFALATTVSFIFVTASIPVAVWKKIKVR